jgi:hypothetical protein
MSAGAPVQVSLLRALQALVPAAELHTPYGMTEAMPVADVSLAEIEAAGPGDGVCVGHALPGVEVQLSPLSETGNADGALTTEPGVTGELCVRAAHVKDRYDRLWATERLSSRTAGWHRTPASIEHESGDHFSIVGVDVHAQGREVSAWMQPLLMPVASGLLAFLTRRIDGVLHVLLQARPAAGAMDVVEAAPTVHCTPWNHREVPAEQRPRFLDYALAAGPGQIRFDTLLSEEGGRFLHAVSRYQIIEVDDAFPAEAPEGFIWLSVSQIATLLRFGNCLNVETRTLLAGLRTLW